MFRERLLQAELEEREQFEVMDEEGRGRLNLPRSKKELRNPHSKSFLGKFIDGYMQANRDDLIQKQRLAEAVANIDGTKWTAPIRDFFGQQITGFSPLNATQSQAKVAPVSIGDIVNSTEVDAMTGLPQVQHMPATNP